MVELGVRVLYPMVGTNLSIHHLDSISIAVDMVAAGLWVKWNWEICQDCWALWIETWTHFPLIEIFLFITATTAIVIGTIINCNWSCVLTGLNELWLYQLELTVTYCCLWLIVCYVLKVMNWDILTWFWIETLKSERK